MNSSEREAAHGPERRRRIALAIWLGAFAGAVVVVLIALVVKVRVLDNDCVALVQPPTHVTSFRGFVQWRGGERVSYARVSTPTPRFMIAPLSEDWVLATVESRAWYGSARSGYVFARDGRLVDWSFDMADDDRFWRSWTFIGASEVTREEAEKLIETGERVR